MSEVELSENNNSNNHHDYHNNYHNEIMKNINGENGACYYDTCRGWITPNASTIKFFLKELVEIALIIVIVSCYIILVSN